MTLLADGTGIARVFMHGRSQAVRLPKEFRFKTDRVRVKRVPGGILLRPMYSNFDEWMAALDEVADPDFMQDGRNQPPMPPPKDILD